MEYKINGTVMQSLEITLLRAKPSTRVRRMAWMSVRAGHENQRSRRHRQVARAMLSGESLFMTTYTCTAPQASITFTRKAPAK